MPSCGPGIELWLPNGPPLALAPPAPCELAPAPFSADCCCSADGFGLWLAHAASPRHPASSIKTAIRRYIDPSPGSPPRGSSCWTFGLRVVQCNSDSLPLNG